MRETGDSGQWLSGVVDVVAGVGKVVVVVSGTCWLLPLPGQPFNRERERSYQSRALLVIRIVCAVKLQGLFTNGGKDVTEEKERARQRGTRVAVDRIVR